MARTTTPTFTTASEIDSPLSGLSAAPFAAQDLNAVRSALDGINASAETVSKSLSKAFSTASVSSRSFTGTLSGVATSLAQVAGGTLIGPLTSGFSSILSGFTGAGASGAATVAPFADGGIVASPTFFGAGGSLGLMGERGAEAIMPLARGPNGQLGIAAAAGSQRPTTVNVTIATSDVESFRRSEGQVTAALTRAVARGRRFT